MEYIKLTFSVTPFQADLPDFLKQPSTTTTSSSSSSNPEKDKDAAEKRSFSFHPFYALTPTPSYTEDPFAPTGPLVDEDGVTLRPFIDPETPVNVTVVRGKTATLACVVRNLGTASVSEIYLRST